MTHTHLSHIQNALCRSFSLHQIFGIVTGVVGIVWDVVSFFGGTSAEQIEAKNARLEAEALQRQVQETLDLGLSNLAIDLLDVRLSARRLGRFTTVADRIIADLRRENQTGIDYTKYTSDLNLAANSKVPASD